MKGQRQLPALTGLRFFLAFWVVLYHQIPQANHLSGGLEIDWWPGAPAAAGIFLRLGYLAVTAFFLLSGFVLAYNYDLGGGWSSEQMTRFWAARMARIYPAYIVGLVLLMPFAWYRVMVLRRPDPSAAGEGWAMVLNAALLQSWLPDKAMTWNYPGWSLSVETFFYFCFPLIGVWLWRRSEERTAAWLAGLWILSVAAPLIAVLGRVEGAGTMNALEAVLPAGTESVSHFFLYNPLLRLPEFCVGILLVRYYRRMEASWAGQGWKLSGAGVALLLLFCTISGQVPRVLAHNGLLVPLFGLIILGLALEGGDRAASGRVSRFLAVPALVFLGNASYAMYILHVPIQVWMQTVYKRVLHVPAEGTWWVLAYSIAVIAGSSIFFRWAEEPLHRRWREQLTAWLGRRVRVA